jgi:hypothetical protein
VSVADPDLAAVVERLLQRIDAIGDLMVERYGAEIVDYATADDALLDDVRTVSVDNIKSLLANIRRETVLSPEELERSATAAARRVPQGIPLEASRTRSACGARSSGSRYSPRRAPTGGGSARPRCTSPAAS